MAPAVVASVFLTGCPRVLYLDYQPSTSMKGSGAVQVEGFAYAGHPTGLMKNKEVESGAQDPEALYLSEDIGEFFAGALKKELTLAGYNVGPDSPRTVSGTIEQFFLDYVGQQDQRFKIQTTFQISRADGPAFIHFLSVGAPAIQRLDEERVAHRARRQGLYRYVHEGCPSGRSALVRAGTGRMKRGS